MALTGARFVTPYCPCFLASKIIEVPKGIGIRGTIAASSVIRNKKRLFNQGCNSMAKSLRVDALLVRVCVQRTAMKGTDKNELK